MRKVTDFEMDHEFFSGTRFEKIAILGFKGKPLRIAPDLGRKDELFAYLDFVSKSDDVNVLLITDSPAKMDKDEYAQFYRRLMHKQYHIERLYNAISQFILKIAGFNKMVVHAEGGEVTMPFLALNLACDYRIVADNLIIQNPTLEFGLVPKGGVVFFLSKILGSSKTSEILLSGKDISAREAFGLGLVNEVVPENRLRASAIDAARTIAEKPLEYTSCLKTLLNYDINVLAHSLDLETKLLCNSIRKLSFKADNNRWTKL
jgi:2-(1,2-epoxy-1,2-dihydrophenyl)acetyl-CoA isomerase